MHDEGTFVMSDNLFAIHSAIVDDKYVVTIHAPRMSTLDAISIEYGTSPTHDIYRGEDCIIITSPCLTLRDS
jgi:hypothetical protein